MSIDPGAVHVGRAVWSYDELAYADEINPLTILDEVQDFQPSLLIVEDFTLLSPRWNRAQAKQASDTLKLIGGIQALARQYGGNVILQQPSVRHVAQRSPYWRELAENGAVPANGHARSATAHGLYYAKFVS